MFIVQCAETKKVFLLLDQGNNIYYAILFLINLHFEALYSSKLCPVTLQNQSERYHEAKMWNKDSLPAECRTWNSNLKATIMQGYKFDHVYF